MQNLIATLIKNVNISGGTMTVLHRVLPPINSIFFFFFLQLNEIRSSSNKGGISLPQTFIYLRFC